MTKTHDLERRPRLSVAMVARDAEPLLANTLDTVRAIADEIVICDAGSSDRTLEVARQGADIVEQIEWREDYSAARNECLRLVTGDWILWLEAGETIDETAAQQLRNFVDESADRGKVYLLILQRPAATAAGCADEIGQPRLIPNRPELRFNGRVREQLFASVIAAGMGIDALECAIQCASSETDSEQQRAQARRILNLANLAIAEEGERPQSLLARAEALAQLGRSGDAGAAYRRAIELADRGSAEMLEAYYGLLTSMDANPTAAEEQIATCLEALEIFPLDAQLLCGMGSYLLRCRRLDLAARSYETAVLYGQINPAVWHLADLAEVAVTCWSLVLQLLGDDQNAQSVLEDALIERPESIRLRRQLIELLVKSGRERDALAQCELFPADMPFRKEIPRVVRGACLAAAKKSAAALQPLQAAYQAGCRDPLCLRWLAAANLAVGNLADVDVVVDAWQRHEPGNLEITAFRQAIAKRRHAGPQIRRTDGPASVGSPVHSPAAIPAAVLHRNI
jgi:tetratricopeptide (TPR) repeat protein